MRWEGDLLGAMGADPGALHGYFGVVTYLLQVRRLVLRGGRRGHGLPVHQARHLYLLLHSGSVRAVGGDGGWNEVDGTGLVPLWLSLTHA